MSRTTISSRMPQNKHIAASSEQKIRAIKMPFGFAPCACNPRAEVCAQRVSRDAIAQLSTA